LASGLPAGTGLVVNPSQSGKALIANDVETPQTVDQPDG